jgi:N-dimethylarginine dimethylaminohydrolase
MYTRDIGFVIGSKLYFSALRELPDRVGEIDAVRECLADLDDQDVIEIKSGRIEGGDVLVDEDVVYVGLGTRTAPEAAAELAQYAEVRTLYLGPNVMHLDTRMTILPERNLLICPSAFQHEDLDMLRRRFSVIEVTDAEALAMGTNVFVIDPETVVVHAEFGRISRAIEDRGLKVEPLNFSEPNALLGSFRCATMPLARA